jgi:serine/threonine protein kinase
LTKQGSRHLGPYELLQTLGLGGYAKVYRARHMFLDTEVAVKVLHTSLIDEHYEQFVYESRTIANLEHPNIVHVLGFDVENDVPFLVMEFASHGSLRQRHPAGTRLPLSTVIIYVNQLAEALQYAHDRGVFHLDVKPENMLVGKKGEILLGDFGIASGRQRLNPKMIRNVVGTVYYMSPEQINGQPSDASDQYALAVVIYEWLTGSHPFVGSKLDVARQHLYTRPPSLRARVPKIPTAVERVVMKALSKDPRRRFRNITEFAAAFEGACKQKPYKPVNSSSVGASTPRNSIKRQLQIMAALFLVMIMICIVFASSIVHSATVMITPVNSNLVQDYHVVAVTSHPVSSQLQVQARIISATPMPKSEVVHATGKGLTEGMRAKGLLTFYNGLEITQTVAAGSIFVGGNNVQVVTDAAAVIPPASPPFLGTESIPAQVLQVGADGDISPYTIDEICCTNDNSVTVSNPNAFSGGQDPQPYTYVKISDIRGASNSLESLLRPVAFSLLRKQVHSNEKLLNTTLCIPRVQSNHAVNQIATMLLVAVTLHCSGEVYDNVSAMSLSILRSKRDALKRLGIDYELYGNILIAPIQASLVHSTFGSILLIFKAQGLWVYKFSNIQKQNLVRLITGKLQGEAIALLQKYPGVSKVVIVQPWWVPFIIRDTLPTSVDRINLYIKSPIP